MSALLGPCLQAYQRGVLAMRHSSFIDFPAHVHLETMAKYNAACSFCPYPTLDRHGVRMSDALSQKVLEIYNKPDFRRLREKLITRMEVDPCRRCGFL